MRDDKGSCRAAPCQSFVWRREHTGLRERGARMVTWLVVVEGISVLGLRVGIISKKREGEEN